MKTLKGYGKFPDIQSDLSVEKARKICIESENSFAMDIARKSNYSDKQLYWLYKMAEEYGPVETSNIHLGNIVRFLERAQDKLKRARFSVLGLKFSVATKRSKYPGTVNIIEDSTSTWIGRIGELSMFSSRKKLSNDNYVKLLLINNNPLNIIANEGKMLGNCCFCSRELEDERSTNMGYGPICAKNYSLPW